MRPGGRIRARHGMFASRRYVGKQGIGVTIDYMGNVGGAMDIVTV